MPVLPPIFDTTLGLGATGVRATCPHPSLHLRERFETLAVVLTFSPFFGGGISTSCPKKKKTCVIAHVATTSPPQNKATKRNIEGHRTPSPRKKAKIEVASTDGASIRIPTEPWRNRNIEGRRCGCCAPWRKEITSRICFFFNVFSLS